MKAEGILALDKPAGMTSHDCVAKLRKLYKTKKVGHTGTLDPEVTGVLPICLGRATKVAEYMSDYGKEYIAEVTLGIATETEDAHGAEVARSEWDKPLQREELLDVLSALTGTIEQVPPMYSAVKVNGKKLYEYARQGIEVERPKRMVDIHEIELLSDENEFHGPFPSFRVRVKCGKGTYIRTLAVMIGERLGSAAHMSELRRTASGPFTEEDCVTFSEIEAAILDEKAESLLLPLEKGISHFESWTADQVTEQRIMNGSVLSKPKEMVQSRAAVYNREGKCLAVYEDHPSKPGLIKPEKVIAQI
ncbi:tRNA pseudouridine(55) synthase TruB [Fictibacillus iocasae]|uniref:tRNA pseudouridine synthase B n=1 Tax=Fictibacillus iocasae TaxID=2715437 RepID=A0ABW2NR33_9BACL